MDIQQLLQQIFGGQQPSPNLLVNPGQTQARVPNLLANPAPQALPQDQFGSRFAGVQPQAVPQMPPAVNVQDMPVAEAPRVDPWEGMREVTQRPAVDPMMTGATPAAPSAQAASGGGVFGGLVNKFSDSGFKDRLGDMMLGWGMGGTAQESMAMGNKAIMAGNLTRKGKQQENQTVEWLKGKGMDESQAKLLAANPPALADYLKNVMTPKKPIEVNGQLVDPDTYERIADFRSPEKPTADWTKQTDGSILNTKTGEIKQIDGGAAPKPDFKEIAGVRKEVQDLPSYKNLAQAAPIWDAMVKTATNDSKASDLNLVYGLGKIMDPTSVVREGEMIMVNNTAGLTDQMVGWINAVNGGARLTPDVRQAIMQEAQTRIGSYKTMFDTDATQYKELAARYGIDERDILPGMHKIQDLPQSGGAPKVGAVDGGYRFKGGNPADPNSWEKVQ